MTKEEFYTKWQPNGFYAHNPIEFMSDLESVIKTEQSRQTAVTPALPDRRILADCWRAAQGAMERNGGHRTMTQPFQRFIESLTGNAG